MNSHLKDKKIVCLGGGIGTVNLIKGLKRYSKNISVIVSVADDGGSAGRIRRLYNIPPPGDVVSCIAALSTSKNELYAKLLTYRFPGERYTKDHFIQGHKLGNLMMAAAIELTGNFQSAIDLIKELFAVSCNIYAVTSEKISLSATTIDGKEIHGEQTIDLGKYKGKRVLERVSISPVSPEPSAGVVSAITEADILLAGPGDLYTTILPVLIIPKIRDAIRKSRAEKYFIINVANKPFETRGYTVLNFIEAIEKHIGTFPFTKIITNNNFSHAIPKAYNYSYVEKNGFAKSDTHSFQLIEGNIVDVTFPLYHDSKKLASLIAKTV